MKLTLCSILMLTSLAWGQVDGIVCTRLTILREQTLCHATADGKTSYTLHINTESTASVSAITESEYLGLLKADTEAAQAYAKQLEDKNARAAAIDKYGKRYYERGLACEQSGGTWSLMRHTCKQKQH